MRKLLVLLLGVLLLLMGTIPHADARGGHGGGHGGQVDTNERHLRGQVAWRLGR